MPNITLKTRIQNKYKTLAEWNAIVKDEFIPLKGEVLYAVENGVLYQKIGDGVTDFTELDWLGSQSTTPDWAENDETAASYIENRTHYDMGTIYVPERTPAGENVYWDGTSLAVTPEEEALIAETLGFTLPDGMSWMTIADVSGGEGGNISRMSSFQFSENELKKMDLSSFIIYGLDEDENYVQCPASESFLFQDGLTLEYLNLNDVTPVGPDVGYGLFISDVTIPFAVVLKQPMNWAYLGISDGADKYAPPGLYVLDYTGVITVVQVIYENVKKLEGKFIPSWPDINVNEYSSYSRITVTDKNNLTKTVTVRNGQDGAPGKNGTNGKDGTTFTPHVSDAGYLYWTNTTGAANPPQVKVRYAEEWPTDEHIMELIERVMVTKEW